MGTDSSHLFCLQKFRHFGGSAMCYSFMLKFTP